MNGASLLPVFPHRSPWHRRPEANETNGAFKRLIGSVLGIALAMLFGTGRVEANPAAGTDHTRVQILYFHVPGCPDCNLVQGEILPELERTFPQLWQIEPLDIRERANVEQLLQWQAHFDVWSNDPVSMVVDGRFFLSGIARIREELLPAVKHALERLADSEATPVAANGATAADVARKRFQHFTIIGVMLAGLVDSLNPCAISVLVFLISALTLARIGRRRLLMAGCAYIIASFSTYFLLGFGLLGLLHLAYVFERLKVAIDLVMIVLLLIMALLSLLDAWRYQRSGKPDALRLKLPDGVQARIRSLVRHSARSGREAWLVGGGIGVGVTMLESACGGQVYIPVLVLIVRTGGSTARAFALLGLYNLMFVMPLIVVFTLAYQGLSMPALITWSRRNVVPSKVLLALLFIGMAFLIALL